MVRYLFYTIGDLTYQSPLVDALISQIYFVVNLYVFRTVRLSITRSLFTVHSAMIYVIQVCRQLSSRAWMELQYHPGPARKLSTNVYDIYHS